MGLVAEIAAPAREQSASLNEVNIAVNQMDQLTQQNAAMVKQATAATYSLKGETEEFARLMAKFRIDERAAASAASSQSQPMAAQGEKIAAFAGGGR